MNGLGTRLTGHLVMRLKLSKNTAGKQEDVTDQLTKKIVELDNLSLTLEGPSLALNNTSPIESAMRYTWSK